jgi:hypothetical protein
MIKEPYLNCPHHMCVIPLKLHELWPVKVFFNPWDLRISIFSLFRKIAFNYLNQLCIKSFFTKICDNASIRMLQLTHIILFETLEHRRTHLFHLDSLDLSHRLYFSEYCNKRINTLLLMSTLKPNEFYIWSLVSPLPFSTVTSKLSYSACSPTICKL